MAQMHVFFVEGGHWLDVVILKFIPRILTVAVLLYVLIFLISISTTGFHELRPRYSRLRALLPLLCRSSAPRTDLRRLATMAVCGLHALHVFRCRP